MFWFRIMEMEESNSPILSCKKSKKEANIHLASPILSNKRKRQKPLPESPVFLPSSRRTGRCKREESPVIDNFWSPPSNKSSSASFRGLRPKSLFADETPLLVDLSQASPPSTQRTSACSSSQTFIEEDSQSDQGCEDDELDIHEKTLSDTEDVNLDVTASVGSKSDSSFAISQASSSLYSGIFTPDRKVMKIKHITTGSARKKKQYLPNGLAKQLSKLLARQESEYRLWRFQNKLESITAEKKPPARRLCLEIESLSFGAVQIFAHCRLAENSGEDVSMNDRVILVFTSDRWERCSVRCGDIVSIYEPWQSMEMGGVTLLLGFNLLRKGVAAVEVSKLSNTGNDSIADGACSSASADSIVDVAENRRPSTVTVLQTWSCSNGQGCSCNSTPLS